MALTASIFDGTIIKHKIVHQSTLNATPSIDVTGESGLLKEIIITSASASNNYIKMTLTEDTVTVGTTTPQLMFRVNAGNQTAQSQRWSIPDGVAFTKLNFWAVQGPNDSNTTAPGAGAVTITVVTT